MASRAPPGQLTRGRAVSGDYVYSWLSMVGSRQSVAATFAGGRASVLRTTEGVSALQRKRVNPCVAGPRRRRSRPRHRAPRRPPTGDRELRARGERRPTLRRRRVRSRPPVYGFVGQIRRQTLDSVLHPEAGVVAPCERGAVVGPEEVDPHRTGVHALGHLERGGLVGGEDHPAQAVAGGVGELDRLVHRAVAQTSEDRAEDLLTGAT